MALAEYSQMNTHVPGFQSFSGFFVLAKLATSHIRANIPKLFELRMVLIEIVVLSKDD